MRDVAKYAQKKRYHRDMATVPSTEPKINFIPIFLRSSCMGSLAQVMKLTTSLAICETVAGVPSSYSTIPSSKGGGIAIDPPVK
uniref:Uncharacterized protein n=1 Tax=Babesia bovis TaxID=5865 RepID=S6B0A8_BABBO|nr:hypothetical protein [Babesia bovis]